MIGNLSFFFAQEKVTRSKEINYGQEGFTKSIHCFDRPHRPYFTDYFIKI